MAGGTTYGIIDSLSGPSTAAIMATKFAIDGPGGPSVA